MMDHLPLSAKVSLLCIAIPALDCCVAEYILSILDDILSQRSTIDNNSLLDAWKDSCAVYLDSVDDVILLKTLTTLRGFDAPTTSSSSQRDIEKCSPNCDPSPLIEVCIGQSSPAAPSPSAGPAALISALFHSSLLERIVEVVGYEVTMSDYQWDCVEQLVRDFLSSSASSSLHSLAIRLFRVIDPHGDQFMDATIWLDVAAIIVESYHICDDDDSSSDEVSHTGYEDCQPAESAVNLTAVAVDSDVEYLRELCPGFHDEVLRIYLDRAVGASREEKLMHAIDRLLSNSNEIRLHDPGYVPRRNSEKDDATVKKSILKRYEYSVVREHEGSVANQPTAESVLVEARAQLRKQMKLKKNKNEKMIRYLNGHTLHTSSKYIIESVKEENPQSFIRLGTLVTKGKRGK